MNNRNDDQEYTGFDDANDFLPDEEDLHPSAGGPAGDTREWTGGRRMRPAARIILTLIVIAGLGLVLNSTLMKIRHVRVNGNRTIAAADIAKQAGLDRDMGFFTVNEGRIREKLEQHPYLEFVELRKRFPDTLVLFVKERAPCANVQGGGVVYLVDDNANVLQTFSDLSKGNNTLPVVIGMQVSEVRSGQPLVSSRMGKVDEYRQIMEELLLQGVVNEFDQINLTDSEHIYLRHRDGYMAELGTAKELMAKIGTLRAVISALQANGLKNGYIDVTIPGEAIYSPE